MDIAKHNIATGLFGLAVPCIKEIFIFYFCLYNMQVFYLNKLHVNYYKVNCQ